MSCNEEKVDIQILRQKNVEEKNAFLANFMSDPLFSNAFKEINILDEQNRKTFPKPTNRNKRGDTLFRFTGAVPIERRSSARLQNKRPEYRHEDLPDEGSLLDSDSINDLEEVVYRVRPSRRSTTRSVAAKIIPVEEVTEEMIKKVQTSGNKVYGQSGTSCHQCRQKTMDTKTICRSGFCIGVRGQFCGTCVMNRYGEDPIMVLKDPNWNCYVCRGCCNCSFCRLKAGKRPTGILAPLAKTNGFNSVMAFLKSLNGFGDYANPEKNPENLLGFQGNLAIMGSGQKTEIKSTHNIKEFQAFVRNSDLESVLGFDGRYVILQDKKKIELKIDYDSEEFISFVSVFLTKKIELKSNL